jgi:hypothetical protein
MSNAKYISYVQSTKFNEKWKLEIWDTSYITGPSTEIATSSPPILNYESQNDKRYASIKGSSLSVPIIVDNSTLENWLFNDVQLAKEERFYCHLYKWNTSTNLYEVYWIGVLLHDLNQREDAAYPYTYELKFTDGLARLKDFRFTELADTTNALSYTPQTLNWYLWQCLQYTPIYFRITILDTLYSNSVNFYEYNMVVSGTHWSTNVDPLDETTVYPKAFCNTLSNGELEAFTFYDILEQILMLFDARIILAKGYFHIISRNNYTNASWKERKYLADSTYLGQTLVAWDSNINQTSEWASSGTNCWQYFPAIKSARRKFNTNNVNLIYPSSNIFDNTLNPLHRGDIIGGKQMQFNGRFKCVSVYASAIYPETYISIDIKFKVGNYYLKLDLTTRELSWSTNSSNRYNIELPIFNLNFDFSINIITPVLPSGVNVDAEIEVTDIVYYMNIWNVKTLSQTGARWEGLPANYPIITIDAIANSSFLNFYNGTNDQNYIGYEVDSISGLINSEDIELPESYLGDNNKGLNGSLYTGSKFAPQISTAQWKTDGGGTAYDINELLLIETIAPQYYPNPRYQGNLITNGNPYDRYLYQGDSYILNGGELNLESMEWSGEWFKIYRNISTIDTHGGVEIEEGGNTTSAFASLNQGIRNEQRRESYYDSERIIAPITETLTGTKTAIKATVLRDLKDGDKIILIPSYAGDIVECELSADIAISDTEIPIISQTFTDDIPAGSLIFVPFNKPVLDTMRVNGLAIFDGNVNMNALPTSDPHINGRVYRDGSHNLKISNG